MGEVRIQSSPKRQATNTLDRKKGSDMTGTDGATDRVLTASDTPTSLMVWLNGQLLTLTEDYTVSGTSVTFLGAIFDADFVTLMFEV